MARPPKPRTNSTPPDDWVPTTAVEDPILGSPYEEPKEHWLYRVEDGVSKPTKTPGRRLSRYFYKTKKVGALQQDLAFMAEEGQDALELVNRLREDVGRWREVGYRGASTVTTDLFAYWFDARRPRRLFFCQREAIETLVYLLEIAIPGRLAATKFKKFEVGDAILAELLAGDHSSLAAPTDEIWPRLVDKPADPALLPLRRLGCKMATGSGKTVVMAMIIAWAFCNRGRNPASTHFPNAVLVCAPNVTVRKRLQVLRTDQHPNYYEQFDLVPAKYRDLLGTGKVLVTNWHALALKSEHREGGTSYTVVQKGEETPDAFTKDRLGELADRLPILVLNDEGHHCWRPNPGPAAENQDELTPEQKRSLEDDREEARIWLAGLDRINNSGLLGADKPGILAAIDLSATPFYLSQSGYPSGSPFPWLVSDFGLLDAIESGIVKIPRLPVMDDKGKKDEAGRPDPKYFRLWRHIVDSLGAKDRAGKRWKPDSILAQAEGALNTLTSQWMARYEEIERSSKGELAVPPVMIIVCESTDLAELMYQHISGEKEVEVLDEKGKKVKRIDYGTGIKGLANDERTKRTVRIDNKLLSKIETEEGESKDEAAQALRDIIDTVGKRGQPGEQVRCVVSVSMLTEGWDATNVTNILGIRAFDSQLLCEQVVGRGLRRMSYDVDPATGKLAPEYVDVYGVPFSLIPYKGKPAEKNVSDAIQHRIFPVPEKEKYALRMPVVEGYTYDVRRTAIKTDVSRMPELFVREEPTTVYLTIPRGYDEHAGPVEIEAHAQQTRDLFYETVRYQQLLFRLTQLVIEDLIGGASGPNAEALRQSYQARHQIFPQIYRVVSDYIDTRVTFAKKPDGTTVDRREIGLKLYADRLRVRVRDGILPAVADDGPGSLVPIVNSYSEYASTADCDFHTTMPIRRLYKSHLNAAVVHSSGQGSLIGEDTAIDVLEEMVSVECFAPNDRRIGFKICYEQNGQSRFYEPDFVVKMRGGTMVLLEIKGGGGEFRDDDLVQAKNAATGKWVAAVNNAKRYGVWAFEICRDLKQLRGQLAKHASAAEVLPFRRLDGAAPAAGEVPVQLHTIKIAAGRADNFQYEQTPEWVIPLGAHKVEPGMVIAQIEGDSMAPLVMPGEYALFAPVLAGENGMIVLAQIRSRRDEPDGGRYVLKKWKRMPDGQVVLESINKTYDPIVVKPDDEVRVVARWVEALRE